MKERWKDIPGYEGLYQVSNLGRILSFYYSKSKIIKSGKAKNERSHVILYKDGQQKTYYVSRLVAGAFHREIKKGEVVMHKNNDVTDNRIDNLKIGAQSENIRQSVDEGRRDFSRVHGEKHGRSKLTEETILRIRFIRDYIKVPCGYWTQVAKEQGVSKENIYAILHNKTWNYLILNQKGSKDTVVLEG